MSKILTVLALSLIFGWMTVDASNTDTKSKRVQVEFDDSVDFSEYKTFNFDSQEAIEDPEFHDLLGLAFSAAVEREMLSRGYVKDDKPDLLINVSVDVEDKQRAPHENGNCPSYYTYYWRKPTTYYRYSGRKQARLAESRRVICDYTEGSIKINMVDVNLESMIWEGVALVRIDEKERGFLSNGLIVNDVNGSLTIDMIDVKRRSTYTYDNARLSDGDINRGVLLKGYILDDVARMLEGSPFLPDDQQIAWMVESN